MANFWQSSADVVEWLKSFSSDEAALKKIAAIVKEQRYREDVEESLNAVFNGGDAMYGGEVLYKIFAQLGLVESGKELKMNKTQSSDKKLEKVAYRQEHGIYNMPLRVCPKLMGRTVGGRRGNIVSTFTCREHCLNGMSFDDNPNRVYCAETLWRRHVMDKFYAEKPNPDTNEVMGGYIDQRFRVERDDGGNRLNLKPGDRTRKPRPHQFSIERRLSENREANSTKDDDFVLNKTASIAKEDSGIKPIKISSNEPYMNQDDEELNQVFSSLIEKHASGVERADAVREVSSDYDWPFEKVAFVQDIAVRKYESSLNMRYSMTASDVILGRKSYANSSKGMSKTAQEQVEEDPDDLEEAAYETGLTDVAPVKKNSKSVNVEKI